MQDTITRCEARVLELSAAYDEAISAAVHGGDWSAVDVACRALSDAEEDLEELRRAWVVN